MKKIVITALAALLLVSCKPSSLPDVQGRYVGEMAVSGAKFPVVAEVPAFAVAGRMASLDFEVFEPRASAKGQAIQVSVDLSRAKEGCAESVSGDLRARLCAGKGTLDVELSRGQTVERALHLVRDDSLPPGAGAYGLDELMGRARFQSYSSVQEAERVYQAREGVKEARGALLPKLSLKAIVGAFTGDYLSVVGSALPFLFPGNWYQWKNAQALYEAERKSLASLRGNEMSAVEGLYYFIQRDQAMLEKISGHLDWMRQIQAGLAKEEQAGTLPTGEADYYGTRIAALDRDRIQLAALVRDETAELAFGVALPPIGGIAALDSMPAPALDQVTPVHAGEIAKVAQDHSLELEALQSLLASARLMTQDVFFEWLSPEGSGSLGFGTASSFRVGRSREAEIRSSIEETRAWISEKSVEAASERNAAIDTYAEAGSSLEAMQRRVDWLLKRHLAGDPILDDTDFIDQLTELQNQMLGLEGDRISASFSWRLAGARIQRLMREGAYSDLESGLP